MKKFALLILFLGTSLFMVAQSSSAEDLSAFGEEGWHVLVEDAFAESKETGKPIMANFTGKDWCGWCRKLAAAVFDKQEFKSWADENVVLLELDYPRRSKLPEELQRQNAGLQQAFKVRGFPTVWVFDLDKDESSGQFSIKALGKTGYRPSVEEFTSGVDQMITKANEAGRNQAQAPKG
ncbi:MAG: thioredoxin family protein [Saprospiraceae bacterium]|nr:thioredoxin family protein [Saprospiraceae bacterium]